MPMRNGCYCQSPDGLSPLSSDEVIEKLLAFREVASNFAHTMPAAIVEVSCANVVEPILATIKSIDRLIRKIDNATLNEELVSFTSAPPPAYSEASGPTLNPRISSNIQWPAPLPNGATRLYGIWPSLPALPTPEGPRPDTIGSRIDSTSPQSEISLSEIAIQVTNFEELENCNDPDSDSPSESLENHPEQS
jgi:hypothetical protein